MTWEEYLDYLRDLRMKIKDVLSAEDCPNTLKEVLLIVGCPNEVTYLLAIRTGLRRHQVLCKRDVADRWTNSFLAWVLDAFGSNSDAQIVIEPYSFVRYCVSYVTKVEKGHSKLHEDIISMRNEKGYDDRTLLSILGSQALRAKETSAQEAAWVLLNFPLSEFSRKCWFINTSLPDERLRSQKRGSNWEKLDEDDTDIWIPDVFELYAQRSPDLENVTLAEFVAFHHQAKRKPRTRARIIRYRRFDDSSHDAEETEHFYRAMCTLHIPWRDEEKDILQQGSSADCKSFEVLYHINQENVIVRRKQFEPVLGMESLLTNEVLACVAEDEIDAGEDLGSGQYLLAGSSRYTFEDDEEAEFMEGNAQDVDLDLPNQTCEQATISRIRRRGAWDRQTYLQQMRSLNSEQKEIVYIITDAYRMKCNPMFIYVDGPAGTGKSVVARCIANVFETFSTACNSDAAKVIISAPTGRAACNIRGGTLHSIFMLSYNQESNATQRLKEGSREVMTPLQGQRLANIQNNFEQVQGVIVDEISMVSDRNFLGVEQRCREAKRSEKEFGGLWTIIFGDFRQLLPVGGSPVYSTSNKSLAGSVTLWHKFKIAELTQNMRQDKDNIYASILKDIGDAEKSLSEDGRKMIESRFIKENNLKVPEKIPWFFHKNKDKDKFNNTEIMKTSKEKVIKIYARDRVQANAFYADYHTKKRSTKNSEHFLKKVRDLPSAKTRGLPYLLLAVAGHPYKLTFNRDTSDCLVNGAVGELVWVQIGYLKPAADQQKGTNRELAVEKLWFRFPGDEGAAASRAAEGELRDAIERTKRIPSALVASLPFVLPPHPVGENMKGLVPFSREDNHISNVRTDPWRKVMRQQFPFTPAHADTIHSSQSLTYEEICMEYNENMSNEMVYVAMSRVKSLKGLFIHYTGKYSRGTNKPPDGIIFRHPIKRNRSDLRVKEKERQRKSPLIPRWTNLRCKPANSMKIIFHNVRSIRAHQEDIKLDPVFQAADIIMCAETWMHMNDTLDIGEGFREVARNDCDSRAGGVAVFSKLPLSQDIEVADLPRIEAVSARLNNLLIAILYCHPGAELDDIIETVNRLLPDTLPPRTIVCGDFNKDMKTKIGQKIISTFKSKKTQDYKRLNSTY